MSVFYDALLDESENNFDSILFSGPIASALVNMYSCRTVTMAGAVIGALGFVISPFAPGMWFLYISFGLVAGKFL